MSKHFRFLGTVFIFALAAAALLPPAPARAASPEAIDQEAVAALDRLYSTTPVARMLAERAKGILIFPSVVKAGFLFGAEYGNGVLRKQGKTVGYYNLVAASYGLQAGVQSFEYAMLFMTDGAMNYFDQTDGFEVGVGPSVVVVDQGVARTLTTTTIQSDVYAFIFGEQGLMAGLGLQGSKITRVKK
jgi:lipid-binding SYLF domain-containing protein